MELSSGNNVLYWRTTAFNLLDGVKPVMLRNIAVSGNLETLRDPDDRNIKVQRK